MKPHGLESRGVLFDFNGTLFLDEEKHLKAWNEICCRIRNTPLSRAELLTECNGVPNAQIISYLLKRQATEQEIQKYSLEKEEIYRQLCSEDTASFHLVKGAEEYFTYLTKKGIPFTICSASIRENIEFFISSFHLDRWIKSEDIVYDDGSYRDKVEMFLDGAEKIGVPIENCTVYEDSKSGVLSAEKAGCRKIILMNPSGRNTDLKVERSIVNFTGECNP